ncbi:hypothetical protein N7G274_008479 [Stereocaulon virgatum]|uniref:Endoplasmic reticulum junction formation protein lunapark n=1 Tax=Stereocaulon virgatum TaxID=373712 RepID=A0ABR4A197_9LECA
MKMVSLWPWKGEDNSPASFEKTLSTLSAKITQANSRLDSLRQRSRRLSVLWTLYAGFAYLLYTIILALVVGWRKWGPAEYAAVTAGPVIIYLIRRGLSTYYDYRVSSVQSQLDGLQQQRDTTIEKLKTATKYNSTQELLKKYGSTPTPKAKPAGDAERKTTPQQDNAGTPNTRRTGIQPPPTANIPGRDVQAFSQGTPQRATPQLPGPLGQHPPFSVAEASPLAQRPLSPQEEFAPNAFSAPLQYIQANEGSRWYDRLMDVLLGEDETLPNARLALICSECRLVNGQAPPGIQRLEDVGKWRCGGCGTMNGEESEAKKIVASIRKQASSEAGDVAKLRADSPVSKVKEITKKPISAAADRDEESDITQYSSESPEEGMEMQEIKEKVEELDAPRRRSTRPKRGGKMVG